MTGLECSFYSIFEGIGDFTPFSDSMTINGRYILYPDFDVHSYEISNEANAMMKLSFLDSIGEFDTTTPTYTGTTIQFDTSDLDFDPWTKVAMVEVSGELTTVSLVSKIELLNDEEYSSSLNNLNGGDVSITGYDYFFEASSNLQEGDLIIVDVYSDFGDALEITSQGLELECYYYGEDACFFAVLLSETDNGTFRFEVNLVEGVQEEVFYSIRAYEQLELSDSGIQNGVSGSEQYLYYYYTVSQALAATGGIFFSLESLTGDVDLEVYNLDTDEFYSSFLEGNDELGMFVSEGDQILVLISYPGTFNLRLAPLVVPGAVTLNSDDASFKALQRGTMEMTVEQSNPQFQFPSSISSFSENPEFINEFFDSIETGSDTWSQIILRALKLDPLNSFEITETTVTLRFPAISLLPTSDSEICLTITPPSFYMVPSTTVTSNSLCISCSLDGCDGPCGSCSDPNDQCNSFECISCSPQCSGNECGDDGCGGSCGSCSAGFVCSANQCVAQCTPVCNGRECGSDGCGSSCGSCSEGFSCSVNQCVAQCTPACNERECGDDGCGGSCGSCSGGFACVSGACSEVSTFSYSPQDTLTLSDITRSYGTVTYSELFESLRFSSSSQASLLDVPFLVSLLSLLLFLV